MDEREIESFIDDHFEGRGISKGEGTTQYLTFIEPKIRDFGVRVTYRGKSAVIWQKDVVDDKGAEAKRKLDDLASN